MRYELNDYERRWLFGMMGGTDAFADGTLAYTCPVSTVRPCCGPLNR